MLPIPFGILTVCGFWRPVSLRSPSAKTAYDLYSGLMFVLIWSFTLSHLIDIAISAESFESLAGNCFMLLSMLNVCCKMTNILYFRGDILDLLAILRSDRCKARDDRELELQEKFHSRAKFVSLCYGGLTETTCTLITLRTFFGAAGRVLPFKAWIPYDASSSLTSYWLTFAHQTLAHCGAANLQIANETLVCGLMIQACSQLELLKLRLASHETGGSSAKESRRLMIETFEHHRKITEFCRKLNKTFNVTLFVQFAISSLVLCSSVYLLSKMRMGSVQFMSLSLYVSCMLYQIFLFCWYGNEVMLQSIGVKSALYQLDWPKLAINERKMLITFMTLARRPIVFTSSFLVTLSIDSYCTILRTSYSVFNLLQQTT